MSFIAANLGIQIGLVVFCYFAGDGGLHLSANGRGQVFANGVGHVFRSGIHQVFCAVGNRTFFSGIFDIRSGLLGVGLVCSVGGGALDARFCLINGGCIGSFLNSLQDIFQVLSDVGPIQDIAAAILKRNLGICGIRCTVFHIGLISFYNRISNFILVVRVLGQFTGCHIFRIVTDVRQGLADLISSHGTLADRVIISSPCLAAGFIEGRSACLHFTRIHFQILGLSLASIDGGVVVFIQLAGEGLGVELAINCQIFIYREITTDRSITSSFQSAGFHCPSGLNSTCAYIQSGAGNLSAFDITGTYVQALAGNIAGYSQITTYGSIMLYSERIGSCIAGVGNAIGCQGSAYRGIAGGRQGAEGAGGTLDFLASNGPGGRHVMSLHIAGGDDISGSINLVYPIQIAIGHGGCTVSKAVSCNLSGSSQVFYAGHGTISRHAHITNRSGSGSQGTICAYVSGCSINRELAVSSFDAAVGAQGGLAASRSYATAAVDFEVAVCALDGAIRLQGCFGFAVSIAAGVDPVFIHHRAVGANLDAFFVQGNLVVLALVQDHFIGISLGSGHLAGRRNLGRSLLKYIIVAQAQSAISGFHQFFIRRLAGSLFIINIGLQSCIRCCPFLGFLGICLVQSCESISHILVDGIEPIHHILVHLLDHLILGRIGAKAVCRFLCQGGVQFGHIVADGVGRFYNGPILYGNIFLHFAGGFEDCLGFSRNAFIQFIIFSFTGCCFVGICLVQSCKSIGHILIDGIDTEYQIIINCLDHLILGLIGAKAVCRFLCQGGVQFGHIVADGVGRFHNGPILNRSVCLSRVSGRNLISLTILGSFGC